jgi:hypothetical protein
VSIYKFLLNALPILFPTTKVTKPPLKSIFSLSPPTGSSTPFDESDSSALRKGRLSLTAQAHQVWVRKKTRRWQSVFAGSAAGAMAIMFEKKENRVGIAQQLFVRYVEVAGFYGSH